MFMKLNEFHSDAKKFEIYAYKGVCRNLCKMSVMITLLHEFQSSLQPEKQSFSMNFLMTSLVTHVSGMAGGAAGASG